jgi:hypothetical protein
LSRSDYFEEEPHVGRLIADLGKNSITGPWPRE